jgi:hypothetical protein
MLDRVRCCVARPPPTAVQAARCEMRDLAPSKIVVAAFLLVSSTLSTRIAETKSKSVCPACYSRRHSGLCSTSWMPPGPQLPQQYPTRSTQRFGPIF